MKRIFLWLGLVFLPSCCVGAVAAKSGTDVPTLVGQLERETVAIVRFVDKKGNEVAIDSSEPGELFTYCTGVWVNADTILTAEHCVDDIGKPKLSNISTTIITPPTVNDDVPDPKQLLEELLQSTKELEQKQQSWTPVGQPVMFATRDDIDNKHKAYRHAKVIAINVAEDLALIKAMGSSQHPIARIRRGWIHDGEDLHLVGNEAGMWWSYRRGYVSSWRPEKPDGKGGVNSMLQVSAPIFFGDSGGGAFDNDGNLVGLCNSISQTLPSTAWYTHRDVVLAFLVKEHVISTPVK